jgi:glycosyltransferase involved in cell wall biosynthesis
MSMITNIHKNKKMIFIPMYNCEKQIIRVLGKINNFIDNFDKLLIVDNRSDDNSLLVAKKSLEKMNIASATIVKNSQNYNLGGSHKVAFNYAVDNNFDFIVVLHGDDQGDIKDIMPIINSDEYLKLDCVLGARFMKGSKLQGYSKFRIFGNFCINIIASIISKKFISDMGSGLNMYNTKMLKDKFYLNFPSGLTFNYYLLFYTISQKLKFKFFPLSWREKDQLSNLNLFKHLMEWLSVIFLFIFNRSSFIKGTEKKKDYTYDIYYQN